jgi:hypothetical protein
MKLQVYKKVALRWSFVKKQLNNLSPSLKEIVMLGQLFFFIHFVFLGKQQCFSGTFSN